MALKHPAAVRFGRSVTAPKVSGAMVGASAGVKAASKAKKSTNFYDSSYSSRAIEIQTRNKNKNALNGVGMKSLVSAETFIKQQKAKVEAKAREVACAKGLLGVDPSYFLSTETDRTASKPKGSFFGTWLGQVFGGIIGENVEVLSTNGGGGGTSVTVSTQSGGEILQTYYDNLRNQTGYSLNTPSLRSNLFSESRIGMKLVTKPGDQSFNETMSLGTKNYSVGIEEGLTADGMVRFRVDATYKEKVDGESLLTEYAYEARIPVAKAAAVAAALTFAAALFVATGDASGFQKIPGLVGA